MASAGLLEAGHAEDFPVFGGGDGLDAEALAALDEGHFGELGIGLEVWERDGLGEGFDGADIDHEPAGALGRGLGVEVFGLGVEGGVVGVGFAGDFGDAGGVGRGGARVVDEDAVALLHFPHGVSRKVVADAIPVVGFTGGVEEVAERIGRGLGFHQPVAPCHEGLLRDGLNFTDGGSGEGGDAFHGVDEDEFSPKPGREVSD